MGTDHSKRFCDNCDEYVLAVRKGTNHILHLLLAIVTGGLWIIAWILISIKMGGWRCSKCGSPVYKLFTTKDIDTELKQNNKSIYDPTGNYSIAIPICLMLLGALSFLGTVTSKPFSIITFLFAGGCIGVGYLLYLGKQK